jgi:anti-anti-sigma factor
MEIHNDISQGITIVTLAGRFDTTSVSVPEFEEYCATLPAGPVILDLSGLTCLSSIGRALLLLKREMAKKGKTVVIAGNKSFGDSVLRMSGFDPLFPLYSSVTEAIPAIATTGIPVPGTWGGA